MAYISWQLVQVGVLTTKVITTEKVVLMDMNMMNTISSLKELGIFMVRRRCFCFSAVCVCARAHDFVQIRCAVILFLNVCLCVALLRFILVGFCYFQIFP